MRDVDRTARDTALADAYLKARDPYFLDKHCNKHKKVEYSYLTPDMLERVEGRETQFSNLSMADMIEVEARGMDMETEMDDAS